MKYTIGIVWSYYTKAWYWYCWFFENELYTILKLYQILYMSGILLIVSWIGLLPMLRILKMARKVTCRIVFMRAFWCPDRVNFDKCLDPSGNTCHSSQRAGKDGEKKITNSITITLTTKRELPLKRLSWKCVTIPSARVNKILRKDFDLRKNYQ